jgi:basic membrane lipoprotein Med (substrate-binding protein (PBP1-ABC) superfamily)
VAIASWSATAAQAEELKVAYLPCGNVNDKSWTQVGYEGVLAAQKDLAKSGTTVKLDYTESLSPAQVEAAARDYASRGYNIVVLHCGPFANAAAHTASAFPKTTVLSVEVPTDAERPPNFWYYDIAQQEVQSRRSGCADDQIGARRGARELRFSLHVAAGGRLCSRRPLRQRQGQIQ